MAFRLQKIYSDDVRAIKGGPAEYVSAGNTFLLVTLFLVGEPPKAFLGRG